jgi:hypothetical protein
MSGTLDPDLQAEHLRLHTDWLAAVDALKNVKPVSSDHIEQLKHIQKLQKRVDETNGARLDFERKHNLRAKVEGER